MYEDDLTEDELAEFDARTTAFQLANPWLGVALKRYGDRIVSPRVAETRYAAITAAMAREDAAYLAAEADRKLDEELARRPVPLTDEERREMQEDALFAIHLR